MAAREAAIDALDVGLHEAARLLVGKIEEGQDTTMTSRHNRDNQYINVEISGTLKPFFYACTHAAAAHHLAELLGVTCTPHMLRELLKKGGRTKTACMKRISPLDVKDMEKAELLGETGALELAYKRSAAFQSSSAAKRMQAGRKKGRQVPLPDDE